LCFLDNVNIPVDNNPSESALRVVALGRKNFLFVGDVEAGDHLATLYSLVSIRVLKIYDSCTQATAIRFADEVIRRLPFRVHAIQADNGAEFQSKFHWHLEQLDIRHVYIRPRTPRLNGKVERSHRVDDQEFYQLLDKDGISDDIHLFNDKLREWENYYNYHRPHGALDGQTPYERLLAKEASRHVTGLLTHYTCGS
jgi:transposase InsO family protein